MKSFLKYHTLFLLSLSGLILVFLFMTQSFVGVLNKNIQSYYYGLKDNFSENIVNPHIIVVEIDEESFEKIGSFPFHRSLYAQALKNIQLYQPAVVAFDILFLDASDAQGDSMFAQELGKYQNIVLGASVDITEKKLYSPYFQGEEYGFLFPNINAQNKTVYSFSPTFQDREGNTYEHFTIEILRKFYAALYQKNSFDTEGKLQDTHYQLSQDIHYPLARKNSNEILISFAPSESFTHISFSDLLDPQYLEKLNKQRQLQDTIFLIGPAAEGLKDDFFTPLGETYGVYIHANILNTLLSKRFMLYFEVWQEWLLIFCIIILSLWVNLHLKGKNLLFGNLSIISLFWFIIPFSILIGTSLILNYPSEIIFSLILSIAGANIIKYIIEDTNKKRLNIALSEYLGTHIAQEILLEEGKVHLDGEERNLLYFFSDIEDFTILGEKLSPKELVLFLREYLTEMTACIMQEDGYVDKFEGDAIMAFWGAFTILETQDYKKICRSALAQQKVLKQLNSTLWKKRFGTHLAVRMGIHAGEAIVGNIGAIGKKMDFTALGDNVNLASRLESVNKFYGTYICVSGIVVEETKEDFIYRFLDEIQVKGKEKPVKIYELLGSKGELSLEDIEKIQKFEHARELYVLKNFQQAKEIFTELQLQGDKPSETYIERCDTFLLNPPNDDWKGVWKMLEK